MLESLKCMITYVPSNPLVTKISPGSRQAGWAQPPPPPPPWRCLSRLLLPHLQQAGSALLLSGQRRSRLCGGCTDQPKGAKWAGLRKRPPEASYCDVRQRQALNDMNACGATVRFPRWDAPGGGAALAAASNWAWRRSARRRSAASCGSGGHGEASLRRGHGTRSRLRGDGEPPMPRRRCMLATVRA